MSKKEEEKSGTEQPVKVVLRRLPKHMTEQEVMEQISPLPEEITGTYFTPAKKAFDRYAFATLTLQFSEYCDALVDFEQRFNGYIFVDSRGNDSAAVVEAAVNQKFRSCDRARLKEDSRVGAILNDKYYLEFCEKLEKERSVPIMTLEQQIRLLNKPEDARTQIDRLETPLVKYFMEREIGRRRDVDARKVRREEKRAALRQKNVKDVLTKPAASSSDPPAREKKELNPKDKEKIDAKRKERDALRKKKFLEEKKRKREEREAEQGGEKPVREYKKKERLPKERPARPSPAKTLGEQQGEDWIKKLTDPKANVKKKSDPFLALELKCQLKGVTDLRPTDTDSFRWHLKVKCTNCGEAPDHWQYVVANELLEVPGSRGEANLVEKCKLCGRVNTLSILTDMFKYYKIEENEKFQKIAVFDCRGLEPTDFDPRDEWIANSVETGHAFTEIDLSEKEWVDFDDKAMEAVEISEMTAQFTTVRDPKKK